MSTSPVSAGSAAQAPKTLPPDEEAPRQGAKWKGYITPVFVVLLALAVLITITRNWNAWEGDKAEQVTDDAYVRGDLTPLSTKVAAIVRAVDVADYQQVHKGDLLVELQDDDYRRRWIKPKRQLRRHAPASRKISGNASCRTRASRKPWQV